MAGRFVLNRAGVHALLRSPEIAADMKARADRIASSAGDGMVADIEIGTTRARAAVVTATVDAKVAELTDRRLSQAVEAGRGQTLGSPQ